MKALIKKEDIPYTHSELDKLCRILNVKMKNSRRYSKDIDRAQVASSLEDDGMEMVTAYVVNSPSKPQKLHLCFPPGQSKICECIKSDDTIFDYSQLNYRKKEEESMIVWEVVSMTFQKSDYLLKSPNIMVKERQKGHSNLVKIFPTTGESSERKQEVYSLQINDHNTVIPLEIVKIGHECVREPTNKNKIHDYMNEILSSAATNCDKKSVPDNIATNFKDTPIVSYNIKSKFGIGSEVKAWISKSLKTPLNSPGLHMIEVAPTIRICLKHIQNPTTCFSNIQFESCSKTSYSSENEYADLWSKALLAEASHDGVMTQKIVLLKYAQLEWPKLVRSETSVHKTYFKLSDKLILKISEKILNVIDLIKIKIGDLVCARYDLPDADGKQIHEVYHFYVCAINATEILFDSYEAQGCMVSEKMKRKLEQNPLCEMQIINMPVSFKLVDIML